MGSDCSKSKNDSVSKGNTNIVKKNSNDGVNSNKNRISQDSSNNGNHEQTKNKKDNHKILEVPQFTSKAVKERIPRPWRSLEDLTFQWKELDVKGSHFKVRYITPNMFFNLWAQSKNSNPFGNYGITFVDSQSFYYDVKVLEANSEEEEAMARLASKGALMKKTVIGALQPFRSFSKQSTTIYETSNELAFKKINSTKYSDAILRYSRTINTWLLEQINNKVVVLFDHLWEGNASIRGDRVSHESQTFLDIMSCCSCRPERIFILAGGFASLSPRYEGCIDENPICSEFSDNNLPSRFACESIPLFPVLTHFCVFTCDIGILAHNDWDKSKDRFNITKIVNLTNYPDIFKFPKSSKIKYYSVPCYNTESPDYWGVVNIIRQAHHFRKSVLLVDSSGDYHSLNIVALFLIELGYKPSEVVKYITERRFGFSFDGFILDLFEQVYEKTQSTPEKLRPVRPPIKFPTDKISNHEVEKKIVDAVENIFSEETLNGKEGSYECLKNVVILLKNVISFPNNPFYRTVSLENEIFKNSVGKFSQGIEILRISGFEIVEKDNDKKIKLPIEANINLCKFSLSCLYQEIAKHSFKNKEHRIL
ncbi:uncharacterized protein cubi_01189 [Cryptosporidium ubiquitum]|uniref:PUB domain-containing protein n=1 Tax=Cryptosporidium ubiquitum TaxID=857276 RepID=A0A1J4MJE4_9CRYT|nr:uncharacterized protein cubi_01189 [Cryptosporidium ubiquitum]OII74345.1 hypothetical protein cubi_01189 [Cryptosporidium ubiquitum]